MTVGTNYQVYLVNSMTSNSVAVRAMEIVNFSQSALNENLNGTDTFQFTVKVTNPCVALIKPTKSQIQIERNGTLIWWGVVTGADGDRSQVTYKCQDLGWYFTKRVIGDIRGQALYTSNFGQTPKYATDPSTQNLGLGKENVLVLPYTTTSNSAGAESTSAANSDFWTTRVKADPQGGGAWYTCSVSTGGYQLVHFDRLGNPTFTSGVKVTSPDMIPFDVDYQGNAWALINTSWTVVSPNGFTKALTGSIGTWNLHTGINPFMASYAASGHMWLWTYDGTNYRVQSYNTDDLTLCCNYVATGAIQFGVVAARKHLDANVQGLYGSMCWAVYYSSTTNARTVSFNADYARVKGSTVYGYNGQLAYTTPQVTVDFAPATAYSTSTIWPQVYCNRNGSAITVIPNSSTSANSALRVISSGGAVISNGSFFPATVNLATRGSLYDQYGDELRCSEPGPVYSNGYSSIPTNATYGYNNNIMYMEIYGYTGWMVHGASDTLYGPAGGTAYLRKQAGSTAGTWTAFSTLTFDNVGGIVVWASSPSVGMGRGTVATVNVGSQFPTEYDTTTAPLLKSSTGLTFNVTKLGQLQSDGLGGAWAMVYDSTNGTNTAGPHYLIHTQWGPYNTTGEFDNSDFQRWWGDSSGSSTNETPMGAAAIRGHAYGLDDGGWIQEFQDDPDVVHAYSGNGPNIPNVMVTKQGLQNPPTYTNDYYYGNETGNLDFTGSYFGKLTRTFLVRNPYNADINVYATIMVRTRPYNDPWYSAPSDFPKRLKDPDYGAQPIAELRVLAADSGISSAGSLNNEQRYSVERRSIYLGQTYISQLTTNGWVTVTMKATIPADGVVHACTFSLLASALQPSPYGAPYSASYPTMIVGHVRVAQDRALNFYQQPQSVIFKALVSEAQNVAHGKDNLGVLATITGGGGTDTLRNRSYMYNDYQHIADAVNEFHTLADGMDVYWDFSSKTSKRIYATTGRKGRDLNDYLVSGGDIIGYKFQQDSSNIANQIAVVQNNPNVSGAARETGVLAYNPSVSTDAPLLEMVYDGTPGSTVDSLPSQAQRGYDRYKHPVTALDITLNPDRTTFYVQNQIIGDRLWIAIPELPFLDTTFRYRIMSRKWDLSSDRIAYTITPDYGF